ncbi:MAG: hypothetical protein U0X91_17725 [Spirosomataceae bacterium]
MKFKNCFFLLVGLLLRGNVFSQTTAYIDRPYLQDFSVKYYLPDSFVQVSKVFTDKNGQIRILSSAGLLQPYGGQFQYPGELRPDRSYVPMADKKIADMVVYERQFVYLDDKAVFSNAWAGRLYVKHELPDARLLCAAPDFTFLVSDGKRLKLLQENKVTDEKTWADKEALAIRFDALHRRFLILTAYSILSYSLIDKTLKTVFQGNDLRCFDIANDKVYVGTANGYVVLQSNTFTPVGDIQRQLPCTDLTAIAFIHGHVWFGSALGAFMLRPEGGFNYYFGERWIPDNRVVHISAGEDQTVNILTSKGLGEIHFHPMTLHDKALVYEKQVRQRHIRYGFNSDISTLKHGDLSTFEMGQRDSDNLWTAMYLVSQLFRYKVTGDKEALDNCLESFDAMQRLFSITNMKGYFARGFERSGYHKFSPKPWDGGMTNGWVHATDEEWDWRGTTSSDQTVGQMFALTLLAQTMDGEVKQKAVTLMDQLMTNIIENNWYLIDFDGKPTLWGKWNPEYVNGFPKNVGDRKLYASNIIGFLQTAYHFTKKEIYKLKAYELMNKHGYLENLLRPMKEIGKADETNGKLAAELSEEWNHSDDEMYFLAYWCLYPYAFTPELKKQYFTAIKDHWNAERPEKNGLWNLCYAMTGAKAFDQTETIWYLKEFPLDMIEWQVINSHRKDIEPVPANFRGQTITQVLPPDERPELKHNRNLFKLDRVSNGQAELSAGDSFLLPYWMGRYLKVISAPQSLASRE